MAAEKDSSWSVGFKELLTVVGLSLTLIGGWTTLNTAVAKSVDGVVAAEKRIHALEGQLQGLLKLDARVSVTESKYGDIDRRLGGIEGNVEKLVSIMVRTKR